MDDYEEFNYYEKEELLKYEKKLVSLANKIVCSSEKLKLKLINKYNYKKEIKIINNGVDISNFNIDKVYRNSNIDFFEDSDQKRVGYIGAISDWFNFELIAKYESFGLVLVEALMEGCYIITSNHESASTIVSNDEVGVIFKIDDVDDLGKKINYCCNKIVFDNEKYLDISKYAYDNFYWKTIIDKLDVYIKEVK